MNIRIISDRELKKEIIEKCDTAFIHPLTKRKNYISIFEKIDKYAIFLAAYEENDAIGYAALYANNFETRIAYITMIGVIEKMQRKQVGSCLMQECIDAAANVGMTQLRLEVADINAKAISFYEYFGFVFEDRCSGESCHYIRTIP